MVMKNYKLVCNIPWMEKLIERVGNNQLQLVLQDMDSLDLFQSGFRVSCGVKIALVGQLDMRVLLRN